MEDADAPTSVSSLQQGNHPLSRKLKKVLDTRLDNDKDMLEALRAVSTFFTENNIRTRRNLRGEIERRSLLINQQFVEAFSHVTKDLESIHNDVQAMSGCCKDMTDRLAEENFHNTSSRYHVMVNDCNMFSDVFALKKKKKEEGLEKNATSRKATKEQTQELITKTSELQAEGQKLHLHSELASAFLDKFQLKPEETKIFRGARDGRLQPEFFTVLEKVQRIHNDVKVLLRTNQQTAGLEIMEQMALQQESAYERLYRWSQSECRAMTSDSLDILPIQQQAMKALQNRPVLFSYTMDEYATARRGAVVRGFIDALTRGRPIPGSPPTSPVGDGPEELGRAHGGPRPIELHAHDPQRYIGDMLAWLHQASASERESITQLLSECEKPTEDVRRSILARILESVCQPLKLRVEQVLVSDPGTFVLYKLTTLLKFYHDTIRDITSGDDSNSMLLETISDTHVLCRKLFFNSLQYLSNKLLDKVELPPMDLSPPRTLNDTLHLLKNIFDCHDTSILSNEERHADLIQITSCVLDPLLQMCAMSASQLQPADMATYVINCMHAIKIMLSLYEFTDQRIEMLSAQIDAHLDTLVNEQGTEILSKGGIAQIYKTILQENTETPLSQIPGLDKQSMLAAFRKFDAVVLATDELVLPQVSLLASATLKEVATARSHELVTVAYSTVYEAFIKPENGYDPSSYNTKTPEQIRLLLC